MVVDPPAVDSRLVHALLVVFLRPAREAALLGPALRVCDPVEMPLLLYLVPVPLLLLLPVHHYAPE